MIARDFKARPFDRAHSWSDETVTSQTSGLIDIYEPRKWIELTTEAAIVDRAKGASLIHGLIALSEPRSLIKHSL